MTGDGTCSISDFAFFRIAGNFGEGLKVVIWLIWGKMPILKPPILTFQIMSSACISTNAKLKNRKWRFLANSPNTCIMLAKLTYTMYSISWWVPYCLHVLDISRDRSFSLDWVGLASGWCEIIGLHSQVWDDFYRWQHTTHCLALGENTNKVLCLLESCSCNEFLLKRRCKTGFFVWDD